MHLEIDWEALGFDKNKSHLISPEIEGLQEFNSFDLNKPIQVQKNMGLILMLRNEYKKQS